MTATLKRIAESRIFNTFFLTLIVLTGVVLGLETSRRIELEYSRVLNVFNVAVVWLFVIEILIRIGAFGSKPWDYFRNGWNTFDFIIVALTTLPLHGHFVAVARLVRVLRVLRVLKALPQLQIIVSTLMRSLASIGYVAALLFLHMYIFSIMGVFVFGPNDPQYFGSLGKALLTMFQVLTLENWVNIMEIHTTLEAGTAMSTFVALFFVTFIIVGTMLILNLVIGIIIGGMTAAQKEVAENACAQTGPRETLVKRLNALTEEIDALKESIDKTRQIVSKEMA